MNESRTVNRGQHEAIIAWCVKHGATNDPVCGECGSTRTDVEGRCRICGTQVVDVFAHVPLIERLDDHDLTLCRSCGVPIEVRGETYCFRCDDLRQEAMSGDWL